MLIIKGITFLPKWIDEIHFISFSEYLAYILGPNKSWITMDEISNTEEFEIPKLDLSLNNLLHSDLKRLKSAQGLRLLKLNFSSDTKPVDDNIEMEKFLGGALILDPHSKQPYASIFIRDNNKGVAILPGRFFDKLAWIKLIATLWSEIDDDTFAAFSDWHTDNNWLANDEIELKTEIESLLRKKEEITLQIDVQVQELNKKMLEKSIEINQSSRRLLTSQGSELVEEVGKAFELFGFIVQHLDDQLNTGQLKKEDLRLTDLQDNNWEAIVEVRGYTKSAGQTSDIVRINRFAELYLAEKGKLPDKRIYVVNGQIDLMPSQRQIPLASSKEDVEIFKEQNGVIISTIDLFKFLKLPSESLSLIKDKIKTFNGILSLTNQFE